MKGRFIESNCLKQILKFVNATLLILFAVSFTGLIDGEKLIISMGFVELFFVFIVPPLLCSIIISSIIEQHHFFEWDLRERKKKFSFLQLLYIDITFFLYASSFVIIDALSKMKEIPVISFESPDLRIFILETFYGLILLLNALFPIYLHGYCDALELTINLTDKPDRWEPANECEKQYRNPPKIYGP